MALVGFVGLALLVGLAGGTSSFGGGSGWYLSLAPPPGTPPEWVFGAVWTVLYVLMGIAAWRVWRLGAFAALRLWGWQLALNAAWPPVFFRLQSPGAALAVILSLLALVGLTTGAFVRLEKWTGALMLPYLGWVCYATYLNAGFWWLNRS
jgi:benzodiazapine receptor